MYCYVSRVMGRYGTVYEERGGRLACVRDRTGTAWAELAWDGAQLARLVVPGAEVRGEVIRDPLLGDAHRIGATTMSALDWARPTEIPTLAAPARLAPGSGGAVMNAIAVLAARAGVTALRYAGPYPTAALWRTLARSFRTAATEEAFTADALGRAARLDRAPIAIDFAPAPHERVALAGGHGDDHGFVELRDGLERATLAGHTFERAAHAAGPARLVEDGEGSGGALACEIWFGDAPYARVATLAPTARCAPAPPDPPCASPVLGAAFRPRSPPRSPTSSPTSSRRRSATRARLARRAPAALGRPRRPRRARDRRHRRAPRRAVGPRRPARPAPPRPRPRRGPRPARHPRRRRGARRRLTARAGFKQLGDRRRRRGARGRRSRGSHLHAR